MEKTLHLVGMGLVFAPLARACWMLDCFPFFLLHASHGRVELVAWALQSDTLVLPSFLGLAREKRLAGALSYHKCDVFNIIYGDCSDLWARI